MPLKSHENLALRFSWNFKYLMLFDKQLTNFVLSKSMKYLNFKRILGLNFAGFCFNGLAETLLGGMY